jgi:hypothetical protein
MWTTSLKPSTTFSSNALVARHGVQKAEENCTKEALVPRGAPIIWAVMMPERSLSRIAPRER